MARTMRDNIARVGGETRRYFVNPKYDEVDGSPCYPDLASLPEVPDIVVVARQPAARGRASSARRPRPACPR